MITCTNCGENNRPQATHCKKCNMKGSFLPKATSPAVKKVNIIQNNVICRNCGANVTRHLKTCQHCRFSIPNKIIEREIDLSTSLNTLRQTG